MSDYRIDPLPTMKAVEQGRLFGPQWATPLTSFDVTTDYLKHVCSARFGEARGKIGGNCGWTGNHYRYDIFLERAELVRAPRLAMRWINGSGEGWLIADSPLRGEVCLLSMIAAIPDEARRWDACHFLYQVAQKTASSARQATATEYGTAFLEGRMKKRKRGGRYLLEILPKVKEGVTA